MSNFTKPLNYIKGSYGKYAKSEFVQRSMGAIASGQTIKGGLIGAGSGAALGAASAYGDGRDISQGAVRGGIQGAALGAIGGIGTSAWKDRGYRSRSPLGPAWVAPSGNSMFGPKNASLGFRARRSIMDSVATRLGVS